MSRQRIIYVLGISGLQAVKNSMFFQYTKKAREVEEIQHAVEESIKPTGSS